MTSVRERAEASRVAHEICQWLEDERGMGSDDAVFAEIFGRVLAALTAALAAETERAAPEKDDA
jgi:hypothetical protein